MDVRLNTTCHGLSVFAELSAHYPADAGYWHDQLDVAQLEQAGPELFIATASRLRAAQACQAEGAPLGRIPGDVTPKQRMTRKLRTKAGRAIYKLRSQTVAPIISELVRR